MESAPQFQGQLHHQKLTKLKILKRTIFMFLGAALVSVGLEIFLVPNQVIDGGIVGISIILAHLLKIKLGFLLFILNLPFLFVGYKQIGKTFAISTLFGISIMSIGTFLLHPVPVLTKDPLLAAVFGGIILGVGVGLVIR